MRIIAGTHRGRPLRAPKGMTTRPTTDRVREALFGVLADVSACAVLDCFAGSGALGLEALSRGASSCVFVEASRDACAVIRANAESLGLLPRAQIVGRELGRARRELAMSRFDLVLADPPWPICQSAARELCEVVVPSLLPGARVVLGHPKREPLALVPPLGLEFVQVRSWGDSAMSFFRFVGRGEAPA